MKNILSYHCQCIYKNKRKNYGLVFLRILSIKMHF